MSVLDKFKRPTSVFDASNKKHREYYSQFMESNTWGNCPYQLTSADSGISLVAYARNELIKYYMNKEFK